MSISLYSIYAKACTELARSIIIKSEATARAMNKKDSDDNDVVVTMQAEEPFYNPDDPHTWRYYMHMAGEYHRSDKEWVSVPELDNDGNKVYRNGKLVTKNELRPVIKVTSLDTFEVIEFTKENLREHRATWREYQKGSTYYRNLVEKYPTKRLLIDGILNPIDIDKAINARDHEIIYYDKKYVEENEHSLMVRIQNYIDMFYSRWDNEDYEKVADLYVPTVIGILYIYLPYIIMTCRYEASRTIEAHSFHVWNYLGSHQYLDEYSAHMTLYQRMWFYRNIRWSEINAGKLDTFMKHIGVVMTHRNLPISEFHTKWNTDKMEEEGKFYPDTEFERLPLNLPETMSNSDKYRDPETMVELEVDEARDNNKYLIHDIERISETLDKGKTNTLPSKVVESSATDYSKKSAIKRQYVELNHWIYLTTLGLYKAKITVPNPTNAEYFTLEQHEALILFIYATLKSYGLEPKLIPTITATNVLKHKRPNINDVRKLKDSRFTHPIYLHAIDSYVFEPTKIISTEKFADFITKVVELKNIHRNIYSFSRDYREHVQIKTMVNQYYETIVCKLTEKPMRFDDFFSYRGWKVDGIQWTKDRYTKLAADILTYATGADLNQRMSVREIQGMMVRLLKQLSSYSIQFLRKINEEEITVVDWGYLRYFKLGEKWKANKHLDLAMLDFYNLTNKLYHKGEQSISGAFIHPDNAELLLRDSRNINLILDMENHGRITTRSRFRLPSTSFKFIGEKVITPKPTETPINPWDMDQFRIHATTENRSRVDVTDEGELIVRGVVYVKGNYTGKK